MNIQTNDLIGPALDWAVAKCDGLEIDSDGPIWFDDHPHYNEAARAQYNPSTDWSQGGPIIEREGIALHRGITGEWWARIPPDGMTPQILIAGHTPLAAAMRAYVASCMGGAVDVPDELAA